MRAQPGRQLAEKRWKSWDRQPSGVRQPNGFDMPDKSLMILRGVLQTGKWRFPR